MKQLLFSIFLVCLCSCTQTNKTKIQHEQKDTLSIIDLSSVEYSDEPIKLSEFVDSISYIRLDETPLISNLYNTGLAVSDSAIFIDQAYIYKYTLDGKFRKSLFNKGQGPKEAVKANKAAYDFKRNIVSVENNSGKTFRIYTLEGKHIGDVPKSETSEWYKHIIAYVNGYEVYYNSMGVRPMKGDTVNFDGPYFIFARDAKVDTLIYRQPNYRYDIKGVVQRSILRDEGYPLCYGYNDSVFWWKHQSMDTIYRTTNFKDVHPWLVIKKNKTFADYELCVHRTLCDIPEEDFARKLIGTVYPIGNGVLFTIVADGDGGSGAGYCRINGKALTFSLDGFVNDIDDHFKFWKPYNVLGGRGWVKDGYLYSMMNASDFFKEGCKSPFPDLEEDSNPVILKFKLKKE